MFINFLLTYFLFVLILSSFFVVFTRSTIFAALFLVLSFIIASITFFLFECEFVGFVFFIVYIGAIAILFLFVVMLIDLKTFNLTRPILQYFPIGFIINFFFLIEIVVLLSQNFKFNYYKNTFLFNEFFNWYAKIDFIFEIGVLGQIMYSNFILSFLISGILLFLVIIGVVSLTLNFCNNKSQKTQSHLKQLTRTFDRAIFFWVWK